MCHRIHSPVQWVQLSFILMRCNHKAVQMCIPVHLLTVSSTALTNLTLTLTLAHLPFHHAEKKKRSHFQFKFVFSKLKDMASAHDHGLP